MDGSLTCWTKTDDKKFNKVKDVYDTAYYNIVMNIADSIGADSVLYKVLAGQRGMWRYIIPGRSVLPIQKRVLKRNT